MSDQPLETKSNSQLTINSSSPIYRLPLELLHITFNLTRRDPPSTAPFTLSHVCRDWRSFLLTSPSLWTTIIIDRVTLPSITYYYLWLDRSRDQDLSLRVQSLSLDFAEKDTATLLQILCIGGRRWKEIEVARTTHRFGVGFRTIRVWLEANESLKLTKLHLPFHRVVPSEVIKPSLAFMPNLESLDIRTSVFHQPPEWFSACTRLQRLRLTYDDRVPLQDILPTLYRVIQSLSAQLRDLHVHILMRAHLLVLGNYQERRAAFAKEIPESILSLPKLRTLDLSWGEDNSVGDQLVGLMTRLYAPTLSTIRNLPVSTLNETKNLYCPAQLKHLGLTGHWDEKTAFTKEMVPIFLRTFSRLVSLHSVEFDFITWHDGEFATAFLSSCPQLVHVRLHKCSSVQETDLCQLVEGRKASEKVASLDYLGVLNCEGLGLNEEARAWFRERLEVFEYDL